mmetsp:Transcript_20448/g.78405  ORF Transcript_20448/g.78405 Transcript_20448/m.78405 type:complete len:211 (-) Transcript_20448:354-986(-)
MKWGGWRRRPSASSWSSRPWPRRWLLTIGCHRCTRTLGSRCGRRISTYKRSGIGGWQRLWRKRTTRSSAATTRRTPRLARRGCSSWAASQTTHSPLGRSARVPESLPRLQLGYLWTGSLARWKRASPWMCGRRCRERHRQRALFRLFLLHLLLCRHGDRQRAGRRLSSALSQWRAGRRRCRGSKRGRERCKGCSNSKRRSGDRARKSSAS